MVGFVRECFPGAAVLILGVSDRAVRGENGIRPMNSVPYMTSHQRQAARRAEAAFWATSDAMRALGGMECFVQNGWAGKDHTHINYAGGTRIAQALFEALDEGIRAAYEERLRQQAAEQAILDSLRLERIRRRLLFHAEPLKPTLP